MKMNEDYEVTSREVRYQDKDVLATILIRTGEYANVEFNFGEIHIDENESEGTCAMRFNYDILSDHKQLEGSKEFEEVLSQIMNNVLEESLNAAEEKYKNELREKDTQASDL
jgi:hypothetical protein